VDLFGDEFSGFTEKQPIGPHEGVAGTLLAASACDGHIADEEVQSLMTTLGRMKLYQHTTPHQFGSMMDRLLGLLKRGGPEKLIETSVPAVPPELCETVFVNACNIVLADGTVEDEEREFLNTLVKKMEISEDRARQIVRVMVIKNNG
jgi:tellurite resistance protein